MLRLASRCLEHRVELFRALCSTAHHEIPVLTATIHTYYMYKRSTMSSPVPSTDAPTKAAPSTIEFEPPLACVRRILKQSLPKSTHCGKDASQAFTRACGIFVIYLTTCANDIARENKRQTITANDVLAAIKVSIVCMKVGISCTCISRAPSDTEKYRYPISPFLYLLLLCTVGTRL